MSRALLHGSLLETNRTHREFSAMRFLVFKGHETQLDAAFASVSREGGKRAFGFMVAN